MITGEFAKSEQLEQLEIKEGVYGDFDRLPEELGMLPRQEIPDDDGMEIKVGPLNFDYGPMREEFLNGNVRLRLIEETTAVRGFVVFTTEESAEPNTIRMIWVSPSARGNGFGVRLMEDAIENMQPGDVHMDIWGGSPVTALAQKLGFESNPGGSLINRYTLVRSVIV